MRKTACNATSHALTPDRQSREDVDPIDCSAGDVRPGKVRVPALSLAELYDILVSDQRSDDVAPVVPKVSPRPVANTIRSQPRLTASVDGPLPRSAE